jgi:alkylated DNA repair protein (DNA oxidative demethylase)
MTRVVVGPGIVLWPQRLSPAEQKALLADVLARIETAPFYRATMPKTGHPMSVEMTNFGPLGWVSDRDGGYRYQATHPFTGEAWPAIPEMLLSLWNEVTDYAAPPEACLVNLYRGEARMGLHQDRDEQALEAPVLSVSLGDEALFRIGGETRKGPTRSVALNSGDVLVFGGPARMAFHGIDRLRAGTSTLIPGGGRINLTLRRVTNPLAENKKTPGPRAP